MDSELKYQIRFCFQQYLFLPSLVFCLLWKEALSFEPNELRMRYRWVKALRGSRGMTPLILILDTRSR